MIASPPPPEQPAPGLSATQSDDPAPAGVTAPEKAEAEPSVHGDGSGFGETWGRPMDEPAEPMSYPEAARAAWEETVTEVAEDLRLLADRIEAHHDDADPLRGSQRVVFDLTWGIANLGLPAMLARAAESERAEEGS